MDDFETRYGFPRHEANLGNWRTPPYSRFGFQATREFVPTAIVPCEVASAEAPPVGDGALSGFHFTLDGERTTFDDFLLSSFTDAFVVLRDGKIVAEWFAPHSDRTAQHLVFSISKSVTGLLAGILEDQGLLDPARPVGDIIPEAVGGAYGDATVRDLLDMRVSLDFEESYLNTDGDYDRYRRAMLWNPQCTDKPAETLKEVLVSLPKGPGPHGGPFFYASPNTDMLVPVIEQVSGARYADLVSRLIWHPLGARSDAYVTVDSAGLSRGAGGFCTTAHDLARLGEMARNRGEGEKGRVISEHWVADMRGSGDRNSWVDGNYVDLFPDGRYRGCWYQTGYDSDAFCAIGIHGQWLYVDPSANVTIVKLSSQPLPGDDALDQQCLAFFRAVCTAL